MMLNILIKILAALIIIVMAAFLVALYRVGEDIHKWSNGR